MIIGYYSTFMFVSDMYMGLLISYGWRFDVIECSADILEAKKVPLMVCIGSLEFDSVLSVVPRTVNF